MANCIGIAGLQPPMPKTQLSFLKNNVFCRYLYDIVYYQGPGDSSPDRWHVITTLEEGEVYDINHEAQFSEFKEYLEKMGAVTFLPITEYEKRYGQLDGFPDEDFSARQHIFYKNPPRRAVFDTFFLVEINDFQKVKDLYTKICGAETIEKNEELKATKGQKTQFNSTILSRTGLESHSFVTAGYSDSKTLKIFKQLWKDREHFIKGHSDLNISGHPYTVEDFAFKLGLIKVRPVAKATLKRCQQDIRDSVSNLKKKGFPISLEAKLKRVQLTVKD